MLVRFTRPYPPYNPGEVAGFSEAKARQLINGGVATQADVKKQVESAPADRMARSGQRRRRAYVTK